MVFPEFQIYTVMSNPYFSEFMRQVQQKAPRAMAEMAHYHKGKEENAPAEVWENAFSFIECLVPPPRHPSNPDAGLCMEFKLHNRVLGVQSFWLADTGNLTQDPEAARVIPTGWQSDRELRQECRTKAFDGIRLLREFLNNSAGVPRSAIYDNLP